MKHFRKRENAGNYLLLNGKNVFQEMGNMLVAYSVRTGKYLVKYYFYSTQSQELTGFEKASFWGEKIGWKRRKF